MRFLITGAGGMLGRDLIQALAEHPTAQVTAADRATLDITDPARVADAVYGHDVVINAAGWTDVDAAETQEGLATAVNGAGPANLARACAAAGAALLHVSTNAVFAGDSLEPYAEDAPTGPVNAYGRSKLVGEQAIRRLLPDRGYIVRTAWPYTGHGRNFVTTMLRLAQEHDTVDVVADQWGQPTWYPALARLLIRLADAAAAGTPAGVYHATAAGETSWFGWAQAVFRLAGHDPARVKPIPGSQYRRAAPQGRYTVLARRRLVAGLTPLPHWGAMLTSAFDTADFGGRS